MGFGVAKTPFPRNQEPAAAFSHSFEKDTVRASRCDHFWSAPMFLTRWVKARKETHAVAAADGLRQFHLDAIATARFGPVKGLVRAV